MRAQPVRARCISTLTQITLSSERALAAVNSVTEAARGVAFVQKSAPRAEDAAGGSDPQRGGDAPSSRTFGLPVGPRSHPAHFVSRQAKSLSLRVGGREAMRLPGSEPIRSTGDAFLNMVSEQREAPVVDREHDHHRISAGSRPRSTTHQRPGRRRPLDRMLSTSS